MNNNFDKYTAVTFASYFRRNPTQNNEWMDKSICMRSHYLAFLLGYYCRFRFGKQLICMSQYFVAPETNLYAPTLYMQKGNIKRRLNYDHHACLSGKNNKNDYKWHPYFVTSELKLWPSLPFRMTHKVFVLRIPYIPFVLLFTVHLIALTTTNWNRFKIHINSNNLIQ